MKKRIAKLAVTILALGLLACGATLGAILWRIHQAVLDNCQVAQNAHPHPGDDVSALLDFMKSESHTFQERSHTAVWTLGRLRDPRALPALQAAYTGEPCDHDRRICEHELAKAIKLCGGSLAPAPDRQPME
jgi:hypothetical protein